MGLCGDDKIGICMFGQSLPKEQFNADVHILRDDAGGLMDLPAMFQVGVSKVFGFDTVWHIHG